MLAMVMVSLDLVEAANRKLSKKSSLETKEKNKVSALLLEFWRWG